MRSSHQRRQRVAHHEAAHAVMVVDSGFKLLSTFLTPTVAQQGDDLGGYTDWGNPVDKCQSLETVRIHGSSVVMVLYAGQYAEKHLADIDKTIHVPPYDPNWNNDNQEALHVLGFDPLKSTPDAEKILREGAQKNVSKLWAAIVAVAAELVKPVPIEPQIQEYRLPSGKTLVIASAILSHDVVKEKIDALV